MRDSGNRCGLLLLPAVVTLDEGGTEHLRAGEDAFFPRRMGGCYRRAFNGENMVGEQLYEAAEETGAFFHSRTPRPSRQRRQVRPPRPPDWSSHPAFFHGHGSVRAWVFFCVFFFFLRGATG